MEQRSTILSELREISIRVAEIRQVTPYRVPNGYFESLPAQIMQRIRSGAAGSPVLPAEKDNPYAVPAGYFENLPAAILQRIKASEAADAGEELEALSPLLNSIGKKMPYAMPEGYFGDLSENTAAGARAIEFVNEELQNLPGALQGLQNKMAYEIPAGYFEQLPEQILQKVKPQQAARVVTMPFVRRVLRYAAAAVIAGVIAAGAWLYFTGGSTTSNTQSPLAGIEQISDEVLEDYLENQLLPLPESTVLAANNAEMDEEDMKDMLADISDEELQRYVEQYQLKDVIVN